MVQSIPIRSSTVIAPKHLGEPEAGLYQQIVADYAIKDEVSLAILDSALTSLSRARKCRERIDLDGELTSYKGQPRAHPLLTAERDARAAAMSNLKSLNLEVPQTVVR